jgi:hypothetical protein
MSFLHEKRKAVTLASMAQVGRGNKAWLVTWEWCGDAKRDQKVAAIFRPQLSSERIRELVEFLYLRSEYSVAEQIRYTVHPKQNPYRARFGTLDGIPWTGDIQCGHNPWLFARLVDELTVGQLPDGKDAVLPFFAPFRRGNGDRHRLKYIAMATSTCIKCGGTAFESVVQSPRGANFKVTFIQCASCGGVVGVMDYYNIGQDIHDLARELGRPLD